MQLAEYTVLGKLENQLVHQLCEAEIEPILDVLNFRVEIYEIETELRRYTEAVQRLLLLGIVEFYRTGPNLLERVTGPEQYELSEFSSYIVWGTESHGREQWLWSTTEIASKWHPEQTQLGLTIDASLIYGENSGDL